MMYEFKYNIRVISDLVLVRRYVEKSWLRFSKSPWYKVFLAKCERNQSRFDFPEMGMMKIRFSLKSNSQMRKILIDESIGEEEKNRILNCDFWGLAFSSSDTDNFFPFQYEVYIERTLVKNVNLNSESSDVFDTIAHEIAHCLDMYIFGDKKNHHNAFWFELALACGCTRLEAYRPYILRKKTIDIQKIIDIIRTPKKKMCFSIA